MSSMALPSRGVCHTACYDASLRLLAAGDSMGNVRLADVSSQPFAVKPQCRDATFSAPITSLHLLRLTSLSSSSSHTTTFAASTLGNSMPGEFAICRPVEGPCGMERLYNFRVYEGSLWSSALAPGFGNGGNGAVVALGATKRGLLVDTVTSE
jgi:hypothetical protein